MKKYSEGSAAFSVTELRSARCKYGGGSCSQNVGMSVNYVALQ